MNRDDGHTIKTVRVGASSAYDMLIGDGLMARAGELTAERVEKCSAAIVTDDVVDALYGDSVAASFEAAGFPVYRHVFPHGEAHKTLETFGGILEFLAEHRLGRGDLTVALGGGVVGDVAGFAASAYARGMKCVQIPTTLLSAVDSSVGGKTAVNLRAAKNMAGAFWQPALVVCDSAVLKKLPPELVADGAAEIIKYGLMADRALFDAMRRGELSDKLPEIVETCVSIKRDVVAEDEFDTGKRQLLNLGHTVGHAVEKLSDFRVSHGCAVAIGMAVVARAARANGLSAEECVGPLVEALEHNGLPCQCEYSAEALYQAALSDKKRRGRTIALVIPVSIGHAELMDLPVAQLKEFIASGLAGGNS